MNTFASPGVHHRPLSPKDIVSAIANLLAKSAYSIPISLSLVEVTMKSSCGIGLKENYLANLISRTWLFRYLRRWCLFVTTNTMLVQSFRTEKLQYLECGHFQIQALPRYASG